MQSHFRFLHLTKFNKSFKPIKLKQVMLYLNAIIGTKSK